MSGADDQRAVAEEFDAAGRENDQLRRDLAETRQRADELSARASEFYEETAGLRAAGDALADAALDTRVPDRQETHRLSKAVDQWRSVRGDAPTQPPTDPGDVAEKGDVMRWDQDGDLYRVIPAQPGDGQAPSGEVWVTRHLDPLIGAARLPVAELSLVERRPAAARTDGQPPADELCPAVPDQPHRWGLGSDRDQCADCDARRAAPDDEDEDDTLTAEQYRRVYDDLIYGLAVDLGLDPDKAGGGAVTVAVRRLVAAVSVPQKSTESTAGDTTAPGVQVWQSDDGDWGWACARCDYQSVPWWSDRDVTERAALEHGRDRCPAGGSAPASTDGDPA